MISAVQFLPVLTTLAAVTARPAQPANDKRWSQADSQADCWSFNADIYAETVSNIDLASVIGFPANQEALVQGSIDQYAAGSTVMEQIMAAPAINVSGTYSMYFEYCQPKSGSPKGVFQTHHGLVGNAGYWNVLLDGMTDYSFAESAAAAGWATLSYDRLGVGRSAHPDGTQVVQISYEIAQSVTIAQMLREGSVGNGVPGFQNVIGVGHSYGSNLLTGLAASAPDAFDQIILTGFTNNVTMGPLGLAGFQSTIASVAYPDRFGDLANDYVITPSVSNDQIGFFHYPNYTESALHFFTENKGEYTLGQQNSIAATITLDRSGFTKPVFVITGDNDAPYCTANCQVTYLSGEGQTQLDTARELYPSVADGDFETYAVPATGHAINFHPTSYDAYQRIIDFVTSHSS